MNQKSINLTYTEQSLVFVQEMTGTQKVFQAVKLPRIVIRQFITHGLVYLMLRMLLPKRNPVAQRRIIMRIIKLIRRHMITIHLSCREKKPLLKQRAKLPGKLPLPHIAQLLPLKKLMKQHIAIQRMRII